MKKIPINGIRKTLPDLPAARQNHLMAGVGNTHRSKAVKRYCMMEKAAVVCYITSGMELVSKYTEAVKIAAKGGTTSHRIRVLTQV